MNEPAKNLINPRQGLLGICPYCRRPVLLPEDHGHAGGDQGFYFHMACVHITPAGEVTAKDKQT